MSQGGGNNDGCLLLVIILAVVWGMASRLENIEKHIAPPDTAAKMMPRAEEP